MEWTDYFRFVAALGFVLGLIGLAAWLARRYGFGGNAMARPRAGNKRLAVDEVLVLDARRRLVLVRRDDRQHLLLLGSDGDLVVEQDIDAANGVPPAQAGMP
jgi:flagellar protein FliO/FliZ